MPKLRCRRFLCFAFAWCGLILSGGARLSASDWPIFRNTPGQTGIAAGKLPDKLEVLWQLKAKDGFESAAAVVNGVVYVGSYDQNLYALDLNTGKEKWTYKPAPSRRRQA